MSGFSLIAPASAGAVALAASSPGCHRLSPGMQPAQTALSFQVKVADLLAMFGLAFSDTDAGVVPVEAVVGLDHGLPSPVRSNTAPRRGANTFHV